MVKPDSKQTSKQPYDERERLEIILSALNTGLALINEDLTIAWVNELTRSILPWDDLIGKLCYKAAAQSDEPSEGCGALAALADGQTHETERQSHVDNRWHYIISIPVKDEPGKVVNVLESVTDIHMAVFVSEEMKRQDSRGQGEKLKRFWPNSRQVSGVMEY